MATVEQVIPLPYRFDPWPYQEDVFLAFYDHGIRRFFEVWHRRSGKDKTFLNLMIDQMSQRVGNYCHVFPQRAMGRRIVWHGIDSDGMRYTDHFPPALVYRSLEQEMMISLKHPDDETREGSIYWVLGSDKDTNLIVGQNPVAIIWSEYSLINPRMREVALPILRRNGGWEALILTPRGRNHAYTLYQQVLHNPDWHVRYYPITSTTKWDGSPVTTAEDVQQDIADGMRPEAAQQEYYLSWDIPMPGAVYSQEMQWLEAQGRIGDVPYNPQQPVYTCWDLGRDNANAIWWLQPAGADIHVIDYEEGTGKSLQDWIALVKAKPYIYDHAQLGLTRTPYERHFGPHDLEVTDYSAHKTRRLIALDHGLRFTVIERGPLEDGLETTRQFLKRCRFHQDTCARGLDCLRSYRYIWDEERQTYGKLPDHDWSSNGVDALRYGALGLLPEVSPPQPGPPPNSFQFHRENLRRARLGLPLRSYRIGEPGG